MASKLRIVDVPASGSGGVNILATVNVRRYKIRESQLKADGASANVPQGVTIVDKTPTNYGQPAAPPVKQNATDIFIVPPAEDASFHDSHGDWIANGPSMNIGTGAGAAQPLCNVVSNTATPTSV